MVSQGFRVGKAHCQCKCLVEIVKSVEINSNDTLNALLLPLLTINRILVTKDFKYF